MNVFSIAQFEGYRSKTLTFKSTRHGEIKLDVVYPEKQEQVSTTVLLHYHGGFLIVGDRYSFLPYWLVHAAVARKWIFVSPDYRLLPETTAQSSVEDAVDAYDWVRSSLGQELQCNIGSIILAGSSAGAYLALTTAATVQQQPRAILLIYGMLDPTYERYTTPGMNIFGRPVMEFQPVLDRLPMAVAEDHRPQVSSYPLPADPSKDARFHLVSALHVEALLLDYMTGVGGLGHAVAAEGVESIPVQYRNLFPLTFSDLGRLPPTMLLHGQNDSAVPIELSLRAAAKLCDDGVEVHTEFPDDAEHGFDARAGNVNVESLARDNVGAFQSLRNAITFLDRALL